jgi:4-amino-4-deoxy-L-arabinose transferase-like glycosyltransferase
MVKILGTKVLGAFKKNWHLSLVVLLFAVSAWLRFADLGFSDFYGDETKTFYLDKTVPASQFFLNQRKGPIQFFVVWGAEKIIGGHHELYTRIPFAAAGFLSVVVFYFLIRKIFNPTTALISTFLFSISGFSLAFSRTIQYQSFLTLFGLLAILLFLYYLETGKWRWMIFSAVSLGLAFYSHYDAVFYAVPVFYLLINSKKPEGYSLKKFLLYFVAPFVVFASLFYIPYFVNGYFQEHTTGYLTRRLEGGSFALNNSSFTFFVYNPSMWFFVALLFGLYGFFERKADGKVRLFIFWFLAAFIMFQFVFLNPGTHILNYFVPLYALVGYGVYRIFMLMPSKILRRVYILVLGVLGGYLLAFNANIYVPSLSAGYPWNFYEEQEYHLFLYGFPYNRSWREVGEYVGELDGVRGIYTNDNDTIAEYYLHGVDYTPPGANFTPQYYVHVFNSQEFNSDDGISENYEKVEGFDGAILYKLKSGVED